MDAKGIVAQAAKAARKSKGQLVTETIGQIEQLGVSVRFSVRRRELQLHWDSRRVNPKGRTRREDGYWPVDDEIVLVVRRGLAELGVAKSRVEVSEALRTMGEEIREDEVETYLGRVAAGWDGTERCGSVFRRLFGVEGGPWIEEASIAFLTAAAARGMTPGVMFNSVPILEGAQQIGKTSGIRALAGPWYSSLDLSLHGARAREEIVKRGGWIYEVEEMGSVRKSDAEVVKSFVSSTADEFMGKYREWITKAERNFVLIGTTNNDAYLPDVTGNARFWPMRVAGRVDVEGIRALRDQIWGEAAIRWTAALEEAGGDVDRAAVAALTLGEEGRSEATGAARERMSLTPLEVAACELMSGCEVVHLPTLIEKLKTDGLMAGAWSNQWLLGRLGSLAKEVGFSHIVRQWGPKEGRRKVKFWLRKDRFQTLLLKDLGSLMTLAREGVGAVTLENYYRNSDFWGDEGEPR